MQRFGRYYLVRPIASGGMADVWLGLHRPPIGPSNLVVIKRILRERVTDPRFIELFIQEARLSTQLDHPNVVRTVEMGLANGQYYLTLEYLRGQTVLGMLARATQLRRFIPLDNVLRVMTDLAAGLAYAHAACDRFGSPLGLVHRDISPSNLFVTFDGVAKVLDFGIARAGATGPGRSPVKGKLPYVSPEQARGQPVDARSDLFALGVVLHEMITLRPLFRGANDLDTIRRVVEHPVPRPSAVRPGCPKEIDDLVLGILERDPARRPQNAGEVLTRIHDLAGRLELDPEPLSDTLRAMCPDEYAAALALSPESVAASEPEQVAILAKKRLSGTRRRSSGNTSHSEITPVPA